MKDETKQSKRLTAEAVYAITNTLRDFGYKNLTDDRVRELSDGLLDGSISYPYRTGGSPKGGTITRFISGQLSYAGGLPTDEWDAGSASDRRADYSTVRAGSVRTAWRVISRTGRTVG